MKKWMIYFILIILVGCSSTKKELIEGNSKEIVQAFVEAFYDLDLEAFSNLYALQAKIEQDFGPTETNGQFDLGKAYELADKIRKAYCTTGFCEINDFCTQELQDELIQGRVLYGSANAQLNHNVRMSFNSFEFNRHEDLTIMVYDVKANITYEYDGIEFTQDVILTLTMEEESEGKYKVDSYQVVEDLRFRDL